MPHSGRRSRAYLITRIARLRDVSCDAVIRNVCACVRAIATHVNARWQRSFSKPCNSCIGLPRRRSQSPAEFAFANAINVVYGNRSPRAGFECMPDREAVARKVFHHSRGIARISSSEQERLMLFLNLKDKKRANNLFSQDARLFSQLVNYFRA